MAGTVEVEDGENLNENPKSEERAQNDSLIPSEENAPSASENQSSESVVMRKKKFYTKKPRTAEFVELLHAKWLRQWIAGNGLNPIMLINQILPSAEYSLLSSENVANKWHFVIQLNFNDQIYQGEGSSKKKAKSEAAEKAVRALAAAVFGSLAERVAAADDGALAASVDHGGFALSPSCSSNPAPTAEASHTADSESEVQQQNGLTSQDPQATSCSAVASSTLKPSPEELTSRIATRILNEIRPGTKYEVVSGKEKHLTMTSVYTIAVTVDGQRFEATGPSKQKAKAAVAELVLTQLFNLKFDKLPDGTPVFAGNEEDWTVLRVGELNSKLLLDGLDFLGTKSPLMWLNELYPSASFEFHNVASVVVDPHTLYEVTVSVESQTYEGSGRSKKQAKLAAAVAALRDLNATGNFAQRIADKEKLKKRHNQLPWHNGRPRMFAAHYHPRQHLYVAGGLPQNVTVKDPVTLLNEIHPDLNYELMQSDSDSFVLSVMMQGRREVGYGPTRMHAMNNAAEKVLRNLGVWTAYAGQTKRDRLHQNRSAAGRSNTDPYQQPDIDVLRSMISNLDLLGDGRQGSAQAYRFQSGVGGSDGFSRHGDPNLSTMHGESSNRVHGGSSRGRGYRGSFRRFNVQRFGPSRSRGAYVEGGGGMLQSNPDANYIASNAGHGVMSNASGLVGYHF